MASGDYTVHCDSDDWMDVHAIKELYTFALSGHYDMVFYDFYRSDGVSTYASAPRKVSTNNKDFLMSSNVWANNDSAHRSIYSSTL